MEGKKCLKGYVQLTCEARGKKLLRTVKGAQSTLGINARHQLCMSPVETQGQRKEMWGVLDSLPQGGPRFSVRSTELRSKPLNNSTHYIMCVIM